jgi:hypothetical protein
MVQSKNEDFISQNQVLKVKMKLSTTTIYRRLLKTFCSETSEHFAPENGENVEIGNIIG